MESTLNIEKIDGVTRLSGSTTIINSEGLYRGRYKMLSSIMSNGLFNEYNFDITKITYIYEGEYKKAESYGVLSEAQVMALLVYMRLRNMQLSSIIHLDTQDGSAMGVCNIDNYAGTFEFLCPENNNWAIDNVIKNYINNKTIVANKVARVNCENADLSNAVAMFNRYDNVLRVNKVNMGDNQVNIIESESACTVVAEDEVMTIELNDRAKFKDLIWDISAEIRGKYTGVQNIFVI